MWKTQGEWRTCAINVLNAYTFTEPCLLLACEIYLQYRRVFSRLLDVFNGNTDLESVKEPDNKETTQRQPALTTSTGLLKLLLLSFWHYNFLFFVFIVLTAQQKHFFLKM